VSIKTFLRILKIILYILALEKCILELFRIKKSNKRNRSFYMKMKVTERYEAIVIELKGNVLGGPEANEYSDTIKKFLSEGKKNIVIDLGEVKFMNSSGLGMLISGLTTVNKENGKLKLANVEEKIHSLLVITKLVTIFESYASVEEALASF
jgi:anti-sigma B factor antagonist